MNFGPASEVLFKRTFRVLAVVSFLGAFCCSAQFSDPQLRDGTTFVASVPRTIRASRAKPGDRVQFRVAQAFVLAGEVVPEGAKVSGEVLVARKVDKKARLSSLLAIVADQISWKKKSVRISAWIVGFGGMRFSRRDPLSSLGSRVDPSVQARLRESTDHPNSIPKGSSIPQGPEVFTTFDPEAGSIDIDFTGAIRDLKLVRKPCKGIGTMLLHDDGDVYLPRDMLLMMEQIDVGPAT